MWRYFLPTRVTDRPARQLDQLDTLYAHIFNFARWYRGTCTFSSKRRPRVDVIYGDYLRKVHIYDVHGIPSISSRPCRYATTDQKIVNSK